MDIAQQRQFLIQSLCAESPRYAEMGMPSHADDQRDLLRALCNVRPPNPISDAFLTVQNAYLQAEMQHFPLVDSATLPACALHPRLALWQGDITTLRIDAIVNAANSALLGCFSPCHSCIDNIIHTRAGLQLRRDCHALMQAQGHEEPTGQAKITPAYNLPCRYVLHTVGPIIEGALTANDCAQLASCYQSCLDLAVAHGLESVAFCCISTGVFRFPQQRAAEIAVQTITDFLRTNDTLKQVVCNVFTDADAAIYDRLLNPTSYEVTHATGN